MIETKNLSVAYRGKEVIRNVSLKVNPGEILAIVGPSGCGKSSFLSAGVRASVGRLLRRTFDHSDTG